MGGIEQIKQMVSSPPSPQDETNGTIATSSDSFIKIIPSSAPTPTLFKMNENKTSILVNCLTLGCIATIQLNDLIKNNFDAIESVFEFIKESPLSNFELKTESNNLINFKVSMKHQHFTVSVGAVLQSFDTINLSPSSEQSIAFSKNWINVGTVSDFFDLVKKYPLTHYKFGIKYNTTNDINAIHSLTINGWNKGVRMSTREYPQGDDGNSLQMGRVVLTHGLDDCKEWKHHYYRGNTRYSGNHNAINIPLFVKMI